MTEKHIVLFALRHGTTDENAKNIFRGNSDPSLDRKGFQDAHEAGFYLSPIEFSYVFTTGKKRTGQTAEIVCEGRDIRPLENENLFPWDTGIFEGKPKNKENKDKLQYYIDNPEVPIPGGQSLNEFKSRVNPLLREAIQLGADSEYPVLLVLHSSVIHQLGEIAGKHHEDAHVKPGGVAAVYISNGKIGVEPIFKPDIRSQTQNVLGTIGKNRRSGLSS